MFTYTQVYIQILHAYIHIHAEQAVQISNITACENV